VKRRTRDFLAPLKQSNAVRRIWAAILLAVWVGSIVYSLVTDERSGAGSPSDARSHVDRVELRVLRVGRAADHRPGS
jgi:hypothetical protein